MAHLPFEEAIRLTNNNDRKAEIKNRLDDYYDEDLLSICQQANSYDGSFDWCSAFDAEDIGIFADGLDTYELLCSIVSGNVNNVNDMLRFNAYGNLENVSQRELEEEAANSTSEITSWLIDNWHQIDVGLYDEEFELLGAWEDLDNLDTTEEKEEYLAELFENTLS